MWKYEYWWKVNYPLHLWKWKQPQKGGDSRMSKRYEAGTPASEKENRRGLLQVKKKVGGDPRNWKRLWGGDSRKKKKRMGGDSHKKKKRMAGTPAREKVNMAGALARERENMGGTPAIEWWYGGDSHKKRAGIPANVRGCEFDKQTWKRRKLALHGLIHG